MKAHITLEFYDEEHFHLDSKLDKVFYSLEEFTKYFKENILPIASPSVPSKAVYYTVKVFAENDNICLIEHTDILYE